LDQQEYSDTHQAAVNVLEEDISLQTTIYSSAEKYRGKCDRKRNWETKIETASQCELADVGVFLEDLRHHSRTSPASVVRIFRLGSRVRLQQSLTLRDIPKRAGEGQRASLSHRLLRSSGFLEKIDLVHVDLPCAGEGALQWSNCGRSPRSLNALALSPTH